MKTLILVIALALSLELSAQNCPVDKKHQTWRMAPAMDGTVRTRCNTCDEKQQQELNQWLNGSLENLHKEVEELVGHPISRDPVPVPDAGSGYELPHLKTMNTPSTSPFNYEEYQRYSIPRRQTTQRSTIRVWDFKGNSGTYQLNIEERKTSGGTDATIYITP